MTLSFWQPRFVQEYDTVAYRMASRKKELCTMKRFPTVDNVTTPEEFKNYCLKSKSNLILPCPEKILKTKDEFVRNHNQNYTKMFKKYKRRAKKRRKKKKNGKKKNGNIGERRDGDGDRMVSMRSRKRRKKKKKKKRNKKKKYKSGSDSDSDY